MDTSAPPAVGPAFGVTELTVGAAISLCAEAGETRPNSMMRDKAKLAALTPNRAVAAASSRFRTAAPQTVKKPARDIAECHNAPRREQDPQASP
ncbi:MULTISPECIES: hypothetical protein [unclassified Brevundimonas]